MLQSDAQQLEMAKMTKHGGGIGAPTREERMKEAANIHIKTGNIQRYCELMVELGQVCNVAVKYLRKKKTTEF